MESMLNDVYDTSYIHSEKTAIFESGGLLPNIKGNKIGEIYAYKEQISSYSK